MNIKATIKSYIDAVWQYIVTHKHAFLISLGVSCVVTILTNIIIHYFLDILKWAHVPARLIRIFSGQ